MFLLSIMPLAVDLPNLTPTRFITWAAVSVFVPSVRLSACALAAYRARRAPFANLDTQTADLLLAGAFGHSRVFESLFGSVSLDLLRQPVLPVLMSH